MIVGYAVARKRANMSRLLALWIVFWPLAPAAAEDRPPTPAALIAMFEQFYATMPKLAGIAALKRDFPEDYRRALARAKLRLPKEAPRGAVHAAGLVFLDEFVNAANEVVARDADEMAHADLPLLDRYEASLIAVLRGLQATNAHSCLDYAIDSAIGRDLTGPGDEERIEASIAARLDALADGKARKLKRAAPAEAAFDVLAKATAAQGMKPEAFDRLKLGKKAPPAEAADQCAGFILAHQALAGLPTEARTNLLANEFIPVYFGRP
jgi:hypothetical protein